MDKIQKQDATPLVCRVTRRHECSLCEKKLKKTLKELNMRYHNTRHDKELLVPYYWIDVQCVHVEPMERYLKSIYEGVVKNDGEARRLEAGSHSL